MKVAQNTVPVYYDGVKKAVLRSMDKLSNVGRAQVINVRFNSGYKTCPT